MKLMALQCLLTTWKGEPLGSSMNNTCPPPPPQLLPLSGTEAKWGNPGNCHKIVFFIHNGIYTQYGLALVLQDLEKGPTGVTLGTVVNNFYYLPTKVPSIHTVRLGSSTSGSREDF